jgi:hypothetical protein
MLIEPQDPAASPDRPRGLGVMGEVTRIGVHEFLCARSARLR